MSKENALELLIKSAEAAIAYDRAIQGCANDPDKMSSYCTAQGDDLDTLYFNWIQAARAALIAAKVSPAAANKATEEGELPALPLSKSEYGFDHTLSFCAADMYEYARRAIAADRASRQVANKEEVEPVGVIVADDPVHGWYMHALKPWNEIGAGTKLYATPPATTGASTVLTDERIAAIWHETACAEGEGTREHPAVFARAIEREVAAQAGQVAVPEAAVGASLLRPAISATNPLPPGCYCKPGQCSAPVIMGRQTPCRDPAKRAAQLDGGQEGSESNG